MAPQTPARPASDWLALRPILTFFAVQISLRAIGIAAPSFAFAFVAIAWSARSAGFVGRVLTAGACAVWVYAISPGSVALMLTPTGWLTFAGLEALGLLAVAKLPRRAQAKASAINGQQTELATLVDAVPGLVFYIDRDYRYVLNNATFRTWFGVDPHSLRGTAVEDVIGAEAFARVKPEIARALSGEQVHFETHLPYQRGGSRWIEAHLTPHRAADGEVRGCVGLVHDIAELAEAREQLRRHAADLETRIRERTASLEEAVSELRILTSSVSHDLRTPLHIVETFVEEIAADRGNRLTPESMELLARVGYTTRRMSTLMQDLLSYTGISHASQHIRELALAEMVNEVLDQHRNAIRDSGGRITVEMPLLPVLADQTSTFQVLSNLISNALKFAAPTRPLGLRIRTETAPPYVRLWVEDNGIGIDPRDHERIFRLFERLDGARSRPGNGVGLALVRKAMLRMGGAAGVESELGHGSRFWVDFRAPAEHAGTQRAGISPAVV